jgi:hypothetical protein
MFVDIPDDVRHREAKLAALYYATRPRAPAGISPKVDASGLFTRWATQTNGLLGRSPEELSKLALEQRR